VVVTVRGSATTRLRAFVVVTDLLSATFTVKLLVPVPVRVPEITPLLEERVNPAGRLPADMDHVYGGTPPVAVTAAL
jgi:hypothetical protein